MSLTNPKDVVTEQRLHEFYQGILPYLGGMPDLLANKFSRGDLYSTDEKIIGQWTDGKPLYQKTIAVTLTVSEDKVQQSTDIDLSSLNVDTMIFCSGFVIGQGAPDKFIRYSNDVWGSNLEYTFEVFLQTLSNLRIVTNRVTLNGCTAYAIIRYTKTTDSAVSMGDDTDYSTTEKIVGTWIDGRPVYQKTFTGTIPANTFVDDTTTNFAVAELPNVDKVVCSAGSICDNVGYDTILNAMWLSQGVNSRFARVTYYRSNQTVYLSSNSATCNGKDFSITVQYTKTT